MLEEQNIPSLEEKVEKEKRISNSPSKLGFTEPNWDINWKYNETSKSCGRSNEDNTIRNISPQLGDAEDWNTPEQSNSEDSSLSDSDKTLVGDAPEDIDFRSPTSWNRRHYKILKRIEIENWDIDDDSDYYFRAMPYTNSTQRCMSH